MQSFDHEADSGSAHNRGENRDSLFLLSALTRDATGQKVDVRIRNLSAGGLMADCATVLNRGERVTLDIRGLGITPGNIAWYANGKIGVAFDYQVDPTLARKPTGAVVKSTFVKWPPA